MSRNIAHKNICHVMPTRQRDAEGVDTLTIGALRELIHEEVTSSVHEEMNPVKVKLIAIEKKIENIHKNQDELKESLEFAHNRIDDFYGVTVPKINEHIGDIAISLTKRILDLDVHRRKWSLNIQGLKGEKEEREPITRAKTVDFARDHLKVANANADDYAACHRLSQEANAGIIMRFKDLAKRNAWLNGASNLKGSAAHKDISISPDLPNEIRPLKTELLNKRKELPAALKKDSSLRYLKTWPYVELRIKNQPTIRPSQSPMSVCERVLGLPAGTLVLSCPEPTEPVLDENATAQGEEED